MERLDLGYPLGYAFSDKVELPAVAVYDRAGLVPQYPEEIGDETDWCEEWVRQDGSTVDEALVAVMLFDKEK